MTPEILTKCLPGTTTPYIGTGGVPEITWEDVLQSLQGIPAKQDGFIRFVYMDDPGGRGDFYAGLFIESFEDEQIAQWQTTHPGDLDKLVQLAIREWKHGQREKYSNSTRAIAFGVNRSKWRRHYQHVYAKIVCFPVQWEDEVMQQMKRKLR